MFQWEESPDQAQCRFSSSLPLIERAVGQFRDFVPAEEGDCEPLIQVLRELLLNAIEHGNGSRPEEEVSAELLRKAPGRFQVVVHDQGHGFILDGDGDPDMPDGSSARRRGLAIVHTLCDEFRASPDEGRVTAWITLTKSVHVKAKDEGDGRVMIRPDGDLSAATAEEFREALLEWLEGTAPEAVLDLSQVRGIDSIGLSVLLAFHRELEERGPARNFRITGVNPRLYSLFQMTRIERLFEIQAAKEEPVHV